METQENKEEGMAAQVMKNKKNVASKAVGEKVEEPTESLPEGSAPIQAAPEAEGENTTTAMLTEDGTQETTVEKKEEDVEEPIRIAGKTFKNQKEAFEWAEKQEQERLLAEAHSQGVREALAAQQAQTAIPQKEEEDDFEVRFYSNPKETLREIQTKARDEAVELIRRETAKEKAWNEFLSEYPDIRRRDAEMILDAHANTIGILPWNEGRKALAQAVYKEYDEITNLRKPKTEMMNKKPALSPSGGAPKSVTPRGQDEKPLSFAEQLRNMRK